MLIKKQKLEKIYNHINALLGRENEFKFNYALIKNKELLTPIVDDLMAFLRKSEDDRVDLCVEYCEKDEKGKPLFENRKDARAYKGLEKGVNPEFDEKIKILEESRKNYLEELIDIEFYRLSSKYLPEKLNGTLLESILIFVNMESEEENDREVKLN